MVLFYNILLIPEVPINSVWTGPVGDVARLFTKIQKYFCRKTQRKAIKLDELYYYQRGPFLGASYLFLKKNAGERPLVCFAQTYRSSKYMY